MKTPVPPSIVHRHGAALALLGLLAAAPRPAAAGDDVAWGKATLGQIQVALQASGNCPGCAAPALQLLPANGYLDSYLAGGGQVMFLNGPVPQLGAGTYQQVWVGPVGGNGTRIVDDWKSPASALPWDLLPASAHVNDADRQVSLWSLVTGPSATAAQNGSQLSGLVATVDVRQPDTATGWTYAIAGATGPQDPQPYSAWSDLNLWISPHTRATFSSDADVQAGITGHGRVVAAATLSLAYGDVADPESSMLHIFANDGLVAGYSATYGIQLPAAHRTISVSVDNDSDAWVLRSLLAGVDVRATVDPSFGPLAPVPEPAASWLWLSGAGLLGAVRLQRRRPRR